MKKTLLNILVTGSNGFIGKNLVKHLDKLDAINLMTFNRSENISILQKLLSEADVVVHLAGENRPANNNDFKKVNFKLTKKICEFISNEFMQTNKKIKFILASSTQATEDNPYGQSKLLAENEVCALSDQFQIPSTIFRFPGIFGKWCKPNYNSVVATFCFNISRNLPIKIRDPDFKLNLVYIDDVIESIIKSIFYNNKGITWGKVAPLYQLTLLELSEHIKNFKNSRNNLITENVGNGLIRALYSTYLSYLPKECFCYKINEKIDNRGIFVEMLKTKNSGQISYFTAYPGITRGEHYHHTKTEKFLVIKGEALFRFCNIINGEKFEIKINGKVPEIVDTIPGWSHSITNIGNEEMLVLLWANENFDEKKPDTIGYKIQK